jgi:hypothetical protein
MSERDQVGVASQFQTRGSPVQIQSRQEERPLMGDVHGAEEADHDQRPPRSRLEIHDHALKAESGVQRS